MRTGYRGSITPNVQGEIIRPDAFWVQGESIRPGTYWVQGESIRPDAFWVQGEIIRPGAFWVQAKGVKSRRILYMLMLRSSHSCLP